MKPKLLRRIKQRLAKTVVRWRLKMARGPARLRVGGLAFHARPIDSCAIDEVVIDGEYWFVRQLLSNLKAPRVVDAGANIGLFALRCLEAAPHSRVFAIEPDPETCAVLKSNLQSGGANAHLNVCRCVLNGAAHAAGSTLTLDRRGSSSGTRVASSSGAPSVGKQALTVVSLEEAISAVGGEVDVLKVDIEGSEEAFLGSQPEQLQRVRYLIIELHPQLCDADCLQRVLSGQFSHRFKVEGRRSSKPLFVYSREPIALTAFGDFRLIAA